MAVKKRRSKSAAAATPAESDSDEIEEALSKDGGKAPRTLTKNAEKSATATALEEVESLSHEAIPPPPSGLQDLLLLQDLLRNLLLFCNQTHVKVRPQPNG